MSKEAVVTFDYDATEGDELTLKKGDVIKNVVDVDDGWCQGTLNGVTGMFPNNFVEIREARNDPPPVLRDAPTKAKSRRAKVTFSYAAENDDELTLNPGMIVESIVEEEEGWWRGVVNGKTGVFPNNFVEEILEGQEVRPPSPEPPPVQEPPAPVPVASTPAPTPAAAAPTTAPPKQPLGVMGPKMFPGGAGFNPVAARANLKKSTTALSPAEPKKSPEMNKRPPPPVTSPTKPPELPDKKKGEMYRVNFDYDASAPDELTIHVGDIVELVKADVDQEGWWEVRLGSKTGLVPNNFFDPKPIQQSKPPPPVVHHKEPPAIPGKPKKEMKKPPPAIPVKAEPPPPPATAQDTTDGNDFGVPTTTPLDSSAVKNRPKKTSRPPSRSNLLLDDQNIIEPPKPEPAKAPEKPPEKPEPSSHIAPWQQELKAKKNTQTSSTEAYGQETSCCKAYPTSSFYTKARSGENQAPSSFRS